MRRRDRDRNTQRAYGPVKREAQIGVIHLQVKGTPKITGNHEKLGEKHGIDPFLESSGGA